MQSLSITPISALVVLPCTMSPLLRSKCNYYQGNKSFYYIGDRLDLSLFNDALPSPPNKLQGYRTAVGEPSCYPGASAHRDTTREPAKMMKVITVAGGGGGGGGEDDRRKSPAQNGPGCGEDY
jgi:hypothetical protein